MQVMRKTFTIGIKVYGDTWRKNITPVAVLMERYFLLEGEELEHRLAVIRVAQKKWKGSEAGGFGIEFLGSIR